MIQELIEPIDTKNLPTSERIFALSAQLLQGKWEVEKDSPENLTIKPLLQRRKIIQTLTQVIKEDVVYSGPLAIFSRLKLKSVYEAVTHSAQGKAKLTFLELLDLIPKNENHLDLLNVLGIHIPVLNDFLDEVVLELEQQTLENYKHE